MSGRDSTRRVDYQLNEREKWVLRLLYTPDNNGVSKPMFGRTRMMKALFLLHRKLEESFNSSAGFDFRAYKYGPFDSDVYAALERLELISLMEIIPAEEHVSSRDEPKYSLTPEGREIGEMLYENISCDKQSLLKWVKYKQASRDLGSLLNFVYTQYPNMTDESEISP